ncbi:MAG TPA: glycosyltransferase [Anaerolineae bacterium]|nr:glycosyltransferase [Anaerolineae bacterium]
MKRKALLVMAKRPYPHKTKTRMIPALTAQEAADLYACFLQDVLALVRSLPGVTPFIAYAPADDETRSYFQEAAPDFGLVPQIGADLGARLDGVLTHCLQDGYTQVVAMNSDSPTLPAAYLAQALTRLDDPAVDVTLGPCEDGGYYLIGWKRAHPRLAREVQMSTNHVLQDTLAIAQSENLRVALLPAWYDVDELAELRRLQAELREKPDAAPHTRRFFEMRLAQDKLANSSYSQP